MNKLICMDIGGTAIKYGLGQSDGTLLESFETPSLAKEGGKALAGQIHDLCQELKYKNPDVKGIAISAAGVIDPNTASVIHAGDTIPGWKGTDFRKTLADLNLPVEAENDVNCVGLSEFSSGAAKGSKSALVLAIGTGIGGAFVDEGKLLNGNRFCACEVGYIPIEGKPFQEQAAASVLTKRAAALKNEPAEAWNGRKIFEAAANGDALCQQAIEEMADLLGQGIASLCFVLNPQVVVLGGGIMAQEAVLRPLIEASFAKHSFPLIAESTELRFASHQNEAGMKGAMTHFLSKHPELKD